MEDLIIYEVAAVVVLVGALFFLMLDRIAKSSRSSSAEGKPK